MGERGCFAGRSLGPAFFFTYLDNNWSKVGLHLTSRPSVLNVFVFHEPISGCRGLKVHGRCGSWVLSDRPRLDVGPSVMCSMGSRACSLVCAWPPVPEVVMVTFRVFPPSGVFSGTTFMQEILLFPSASCVLPVIISLLLPLSVVPGRIRTLLHSKSITFSGKGYVSTCISWNFNRPSLMADWICRRNTLQSLVAWENELCHLQYARRFSSLVDGTIWFILILPFLSNSSNILSHLPTLNVNLTSSCRFFWTDYKEEQAEDLACFGQTISAAYTSVDSSSELLWSHSTICTLWRIVLAVSLLRLSQAKALWWNCASLKNWTPSNLSFK
jgi:hypothetical protein